MSRVRTMLERDSEEALVTLDATPSAVAVHFFIQNLKEALSLVLAGLDTVQEHERFGPFVATAPRARLESDAAGICAVTICARLEAHVLEVAERMLPAPWTKDDRAKLKLSGKHNWPLAVRYAFDLPTERVLFLVLRTLVRCRNDFAHTGSCRALRVEDRVATWTVAAIRLVQLVEVALQRHKGGWHDPITGLAVLTTEAKPPPPSRARCKVCGR